MTRENILELAKEVITKNRNDRYGEPEKNFNTIAEFWSNYKGVDFTATDVAIMMTLLKIVRIKNGKPHLDNFVDAIGYLACASELE